MNDQLAGWEGTADKARSGPSMLAPTPFPIKLILRTIGARQYRRHIKEVRGLELGR